MSSYSLENSYAVGLKHSSVPVSGISAFTFRSTGKIHPTASACKVQSSSPCWVLPRTTEGVTFACGSPKLHRLEIR
jgi:hypothetical protein